MDLKLKWVTLETIFWVHYLLVAFWFCFIWFCVSFVPQFVSFLVVDESSLGQSKAKCVCSFLQELNDAVKAKFVEEYPEALIETNPSFFSQFTLVVATQVCHYNSYNFCKMMI